MLGRNLSTVKTKIRFGAESDSYPAEMALFMMNR